MVDAEVSKTSDASRASSSLASGTSFQLLCKHFAIFAALGVGGAGVIRRSVAMTNPYLAKIPGHWPDWRQG